MDKWSFQKEAIKLTKNKLANNKSLIGFVGGPYTLFKFAIGKKNKIVLKKDSFEIDYLNNTLVPLLIKNIQGLPRYQTIKAMFCLEMVSSN